MKNISRLISFAFLTQFSLQNFVWAMGGDVEAQVTAPLAYQYIQRSILEDRSLSPEVETIYSQLVSESLGDLDSNRDKEKFVLEVYKIVHDFKVKKEFQDSIPVLPTLESGYQGYCPKLSLNKWVVGGTVFVAGTCVAVGSIVYLALRADEDRVTYDPTYQAVAVVSGLGIGSMLMSGGYLYNQHFLERISKPLTTSVVVGANFPLFIEYIQFLQRRWISGLQTEKRIPVTVLDPA